MREYGQVQCAFWGHPDICDLSDQAKLLAMYVLTGPNSNGLGCYRLPPGYVAEDLGWSQETVSKRFAELFRVGFLKHCERTRYVFIPHFLRWNPVANENVAKARMKEFQEIPSQFEYYQELASSMLYHAEHWPEPFRNRLETVRETVSKQDPTRPDPNPNPDPDPDPEVSTPSPSGSPSRAPQSAAPPTNGAAARFEEFWAQYPSGHRKAKKRCREIWVRKRLDERADEILADLARRPESDDQWIQGFIPNPSTYLNQERWGDDYRAPGRHSGTEDPQRRARRMAEERRHRLAVGGEQR